MFATEQFRVSDWDKEQPGCHQLGWSTLLRCHASTTKRSMTEQTAPNVLILVINAVAGMANQLLCEDKRSYSFNPAIIPAG